jgi:RND family efflux transporter MFP subunit
MRLAYKVGFYDFPSDLIMRSLWLKRLSPILVILAAIGIFSALQANKPEPDKQEPAARVLQVYTEPASIETTLFDVSTQGEVKARTNINLSAQVAGRIEWVSDQFISGGSIPAGDPILKIESIDYELAVNQAQAALANAQVVLEKAVADANVAKQQLVGVPNPSPLALKIPQVNEAKANLKGAQAALQRAELNQKRTSITLPYNARITETSVQVGQYVGPGQTLGRAISTELVFLRLPLKQEELKALGLPIGYSAKAGNQGPTVLLSREISGTVYQWEATLTHIESIIDPVSRMVHAIVQKIEPYAPHNANQGMPLAVGFYVDALIRGGEPKDMIAIPRNALRPGNRVFTIQDGRLAVVQVTVAHSNQEKAYIATGLNAGDHVIISPIRNPVEGMAIRSIDAGAPISEESAL